MSAVTLVRLATPLDANWRLRGNCRWADPDFMHPAERDYAGQEAAKAICEGCPVQQKCLDDAIEADDWNGIRGGMTGKERRRHVTGDRSKPCARCGESFIPRLKQQKQCTACVKATNGELTGAKRRECRACGTHAAVNEETGQLGRHRVPGRNRRRAFCRGEVTETEQRADYLHQISRCEHRPEWRQAGGLCGGCGRDGFAEITEETEMAA